MRLGSRLQEMYFFQKELVFHVFNLFMDSELSFLKSTCIILHGTGTEAHKVNVFQSPRSVHFCSKPWKYYCGHYYCSSKRSVSIFIYLINDIVMKEWGYFSFGKIWWCCSQSRRNVFFMADAVCMCVISVHQNLNILYACVLYIFPRSFVNPFPCVLCWKTELQYKSNIFWAFYLSIRVPLFTLPVWNSKLVRCFFQYKCFGIPVSYLLIRS